MENRKYFKKLDEILQELLGKRELPTIDSFLESFGTFDTEKGSDTNGDWVKSTFKSNDGSYTQISWVFHSKPEIKNESKDRIGDLQKQLERCIEKQDFEQAAEIRDEIKLMKNNRSKIDSMKKELDEAIKREDFEKAIELRDELKKIN